MNKLRVLSFLFVGFSLAVTTAFGEIQVVDQQNLNTEGLIANPSSRFSQSFTASATWMNTVEVIVYVSGTQNLTLDLTLFAGNGLESFLRSAGSVTVSPADGPIPVEFRFYRPVGLQPGKVYTFSIGSRNLIAFAARYGSDTYTGGNMFDSYYIYPDRDLYFREGLNVPGVNISWLPNQQLRLQGTAVPNSSVPISASDDLSANSFVPRGNANADVNGNWQYDDALPAGVTNRFYRATLP